MVLDHIVPETKSGKTEFDNLCFAYRRCNEFKGATTQIKDPVTQQMVSLFHPRQQKWSDHLAWDDSGVHLVGLTATGRVTVIALNINNELILDSRSLWVSVGWHPPRHV